MVFVQIKMKQLSVLLGNLPTILQKKVLKEKRKFYFLKQIHATKGHAFNWGNSVTNSVKF